MIVSENISSTDLADSALDPHLLPLHGVYNRVSHRHCLSDPVDMLCRVIDPGNAFTDSEAAFYLLDGIPMLLLVLCFVLVWPPLCLGSGEEFHKMGKQGTIDHS